MRIVTTPMCEEIVRLAGISDYAVNKFPDKKDGDLAILLSESKVEMDSLPIKINTPKQIFESIKEVSKLTQNELSDEEIQSFFDDFEILKKSVNPVRLKNNPVELNSDDIDMLYHQILQKR